MPSDVDKMFEDLFGYSGGKPKPPPKVDEHPSDVEAKPGTVDDAARAVQEAVRASKRRRPVKVWRPVAAKVLGLKRLVQKRWQGVLDRGVEMGLFTIDEDTLSYPILVPAEPEPEPEPEEEDPEIVASRLERERAREQLKLPPPPPKDPPKDWNPPRYMECGHWDCQSWPRPLEEGEDRLKRKTTLFINHRATGPEDCEYCKQGKPGHPMHQTGEYRKPVSESQRRTKEKERGMGWPGYCVDEDGYYIGGIANHCRHANPKGPWCSVHKRVGSIED